MLEGYLDARNENPSLFGKYHRFINEPDYSWRGIGKLGVRKHAWIPNVTDKKQHNIGVMNINR